MSWWLRKDEIDSKKECFGIFRADNNPAKWEVNPSGYFLASHTFKISHRYIYHSGNVMVSYDHFIMWPPSTHHHAEFE